MKKLNKTALMYELHFIPSFKRKDFIQNVLKEQEVKDAEALTETILEEFDASIGILNLKQFENLIQIIKTNFSLSTLGTKLDLYNVKPEYIESILKFCKEYHQNLESNDFEEILSTDLEITLQNFKKIIKQGWIGDWESNPEDDQLSMVKIPAFIESGKKKRFFLAKIFKTIPIKYKDKIRYRIYFSNPRIVVV